MNNLGEAKLKYSENNMKNWLPLPAYLLVQTDHHYSLQFDSHVFPSVLDATAEMKIKDIKKVQFSE